MGALLLAFAPLLAGITQPLKDWFGYKVEAVKAEQDLKLATIKAQADQVTAQLQSDASQLSVRLGSTSGDFKQNTFWLLCVPIGFSLLLPSKAEVMWHNFSLIPEFFQWLFLSVYSSIWGIPIAKSGYGAITDLLQSKREFAVQKIQVLNEAAVAASLRKTIFKQGMTQEQWDNILSAIKDGGAGVQQQ